jgi:hypothetical protein
MEENRRVRLCLQLLQKHLLVLYRNTPTTGRLA